MSGDDHSLFTDDTHVEDMRTVLDDTDYDTELGLELARDAQRVVAGDISEAEFEQRYHDAVVEEFGEDNRVFSDAFEDLDADVDAAAEAHDGDYGAAIRDLLDRGELSRRDLMKAGAGAGALAVGLSGMSADPATAAGESGDGGGHGAANATHAGGGEGTQYGMVINLNNCDGCLECVVACKGLHGTSEAAHWIYVMAYQQAGEGEDEENFLVRPCMHCDEAPCEKVCPVGARHTREKDGLVLSNYEICIGCRYCMVSCPYGANYFQWGDPDNDPAEMDENFTHDSRGLWVDGPPPNGVMGKCTFEPSWQDGAMGDALVGTTMCEQACTRDAIHFGDMNDPESAPNKHLEAYNEAHQNDKSEFENRTDSTVSTFRLLEDLGTDPNVKFIGEEPSPHAHQVEGPVTYEEMGMTDNRRKDVLDKGAAANEEGENA